jgi:hypothetical protein
MGGKQMNIYKVKHIYTKAIISEISIMATDYIVAKSHKDIQRKINKYYNTKCEIIKSKRIKTGIIL